MKNAVNLCSFADEPKGNVGFLVCAKDPKTLLSSRGAEGAGRVERNSVESISESAVLIRPEAMRTHRRPH